MQDLKTIYTNTDKGLIVQKPNEFPVLLNSIKDRNDKKLYPEGMLMGHIASNNINRNIINTSNIVLHSKDSKVT